MSDKKSIINNGQALKTKVEKVSDGDTVKGDTQIEAKVNTVNRKIGKKIIKEAVVLTDKLHNSNKDEKEVAETFLKNFILRNAKLF